MRESLHPTLHRLVVASLGGGLRGCVRDCVDSLTRSAPSLQLTGPTDPTAVDTFLSSFKPSRNNDSLGEFTWVRLRKDDDEGETAAAREERKDKLRRKGKRVLDGLADRLEEIRVRAPLARLVTVLGSRLTLTPLCTARRRRRPFERPETSARRPTVRHPLALVEPLLRFCAV